MSTHKTCVVQTKENITDHQLKKCYSFVKAGIKLYRDVLMDPEFKPAICVC